MATDYGQCEGTCQICGKPVRTRRVGTVWRHKNAAGNDCPGGNRDSVEAARPMSGAEVQAELAAMYRGAGWTDEEITERSDSETRGAA